MLKQKHTRHSDDRSILTVLAPENAKEKVVPLPESRTAKKREMMKAESRSGKLKSWRKANLERETQRNREGRDRDGAKMRRQWLDSAEKVRENGPDERWPATVAFPAETVAEATARESERGKWRWWVEWRGLGMRVVHRLSLSDFKAFLLNYDS